MTPIPETERFVSLPDKTADRQTLSHMALSAADQRERARLLRVRRAADLHHHCVREVTSTMSACPVCGTVLKTLDDFQGGF